MRSATSCPIARTRERWMRERPIAAIPTLASSIVRMAIAPPGSSFAAWVAQLASRYTSTVGMTTAAQMPGRSWVAARTGSRKKPTTSTSDAQLSLASLPASSARVATTTRSTNSPSHAHRATAGPPDHAQRPKATAPTPYTATIT